MLLIALGLVGWPGCTTLRAGLGLCQTEISVERKAEAEAARAFTERSFAQALAEQQLELVEPSYREHHSSDHVDEQPGTWTYRYSELLPPTAEALPLFGRDAQGVLHLIERQPQLLETRRYPLCECKPGYNKGITPGEILRVYQTGELGPPIRLRYQVKKVIFTRKRCPDDGPPRV